MVTTTASTTMTSTTMTAAADSEISAATPMAVGQLRRRHRQWRRWRRCRRHVDGDGNDNTDDDGDGYDGDDGDDWISGGDGDHIADIWVVCYICVRVVSNASNLCVCVYMRDECVYVLCAYMCRISKCKSVGWRLYMNIYIYIYVFICIYIYMHTYS